VTLAYLRRADPAEVAAWIQANNLLKSPPIHIDRFGLYSSTRPRRGRHTGWRRSTAGLSRRS
jgi:2'-5' RNA ligase